MSTMTIRDHQQLVQGIIRGVSDPSAETPIREFKLETRCQNQLLFFFKPECFLHNDARTQEALIDCVLTNLAEYNVAIDGAIVLAGPLLADLQKMDRHYGYINRISRGASHLLPNEEQDGVRAALGAPANAPLLGGHEFLMSHRDFTAQSLDALWATKKSKKVRSGLYAQVYRVAAEEIVLVNAFHPAQLLHFTAPERRIALLLLHSDMPWRVLRERMLGSTFPESALPGSIRRTIFDRQSEFGLSGVGIAKNCTHLSAGPLEAFFEISNFLAGLESVSFHASQSNVARALSDTTRDTILEAILRNPSLTVNGSTTDLYTLTEDLDTFSSLRFAEWLIGRIAGAGVAS